MITPAYSRPRGPVMFPPLYRLAVILRRMRATPHPWAWWGKRRDPITGQEGSCHDGIDLGELEGEPVYAAGAGHIEIAATAPRAGKYVRILHGLSDCPVGRTGYCHLSEFAPWVQAGAEVARGQIIGYVGQTGACKGAHLHFQCWVFDGANYKNVDPLPYLEGSLLEVDSKTVADLMRAAKGD